MASRTQTCYRRCAEAAERTASERQADAHRMLHYVRLMAERKAREAAATTAGMADAAQRRELLQWRRGERAAAANERRVCHTPLVVNCLVGGVM